MANNDVSLISGPELQQLLNQNEPMVLVDTRAGAAFSAEHISGAINVYFDPSGDPMEREMMLTTLPSNKLIVIYCD